ncbi:MAG TPA: acetolactate decarboxylase [Dyella sp.]|uniref:acetolactate decarboxylase n=1 Tax=Dyella sp. TaxID=1869338 RepID=UPI002D7A27D7|nr:acetolactate decarboxylase [Dyella sp.]HET6554229.1 acetolactate decarboxylase [Dyella sp.]
MSNEVFRPLRGATRAQPAAALANTQHTANRLFQTSTMSALLDGVYDGDFTIDALLEHGDFGLGTFNALNGEMIVNDSDVHQLHAEGGVSDVPLDALTPFACVTFFKPEQRFELERPMTKAEFEALIDERIGNSNLIVAVRFTGIFEDVHTRTVFCQCKPYPKMLEVVAKQPTIRFGATSGTMLGFRTPIYMQGINVAGYHVHFLDMDAGKGGHVMDYKLHAGEVELAVISDVEIALPRNEAFAKADLNPADLHESIRIAEGE